MNATVHGDDVADQMLPVALRLIDAVHQRDQRRVGTALTSAGGLGGVAALAVVLAELAPDTAERAALTVLRNADGPADADLLLDVLGIAGRQERAA